MTVAFTEMANSMASAFSREKPGSPNKPPTSMDSTHTGVLPGRRIELQEKLLRQIDLLHKMFEKGAITSQQFEKRRESLLLQMDGLAD